jgi:hypothetical protein
MGKFENLKMKERKNLKILKFENLKMEEGTEKRIERLPGNCCERKKQGGFLVAGQELHDEAFLASHTCTFYFFKQQGNAGGKLLAVSFWLLASHFWLLSSS